MYLRRKRHYTSNVGIKMESEQQELHRILRERGVNGPLVIRLSTRGAWEVNAPQHRGQLPISHINNTPITKVKEYGVPVPNYKPKT